MTAEKNKRGPEIWNKNFCVRDALSGDVVHPLMAVVQLADEGIGLGQFNICGCE